MRLFPQDMVMHIRTGASDVLDADFGEMNSHWRVWSLSQNTPTLDWLRSVALP